MKLFETTEDGPINWENRKSVGTEDEYNRAVKQEASMQHRRQVFVDKVLQYSHVVVKEWKPENFKIPVVDKIKVYGRWWGVPADTPNADKLWKALKFYVDRYDQADKMIGRYGRLVTKLRKKFRAEIVNDLQSKEKAVRINAVDVPHKIYYAKNKYFDNPYWERENVVQRYAGPVGHFPHYTTAELNVLVELEKSLKKFGLPGMTKVFGCTVKIGGPGSHNKNRFVAFGAEGRLIWKCVNGNYIYIDGKRVPITAVINVVGASSKAELDQRKYLEPLLTPK